MRSRIITAAIVIIAAVGCLAYQRRAPRIVRADAGCDATILNAAYGYSFSGFIIDNAGNLNLFSAAGRAVPDGQGGLSGKDTFSFDGSIVRGRTYTGTYTVNSDCTGSITLSDPTNVTINADFVITNNGNELQLVESDRGSNISGSAKRQVIPAPAAN
jgi:hypothetical protein